MKRTVFLKNAAILTVTSLILRTVGIVFRLYLSGKIGAEGMGLYQLILSIYVLGATFATSGISTAVTRLVADELVCGTPRSVRHILRRSILISLVVGVISALVIFCCAEPISRLWLKDTRAIGALRTLAWSLPSMGISACLKGYFVARRRAANTSYAQLLEQAVRMLLIVLLIDRSAAKGLAAACTTVMLGDTVAEWASCAYVGLSYGWDRRRLKRETAGLPAPNVPRKPVVRQLLNIAAPITAGRYLNSLLRTVENLLVPSGIARYTGSRELGLSQFGALKGMALPLIFFPASFLSAMSTLLVPELSSANARDRQDSIRRAVEKALRITLLASMLIGAVFTVFAAPLGQLLYGSREVGVYLRVLAPLVPIMYGESIVDGMLKGLNQQMSSLKYSVADSAIRIVLILLLVPWRGMGAFLFIMVISNLLTSLLNLNRLLTVTAFRLDWYTMAVKPLFAAITAAAVALAVGRLPLMGSLPLIPQTVLGVVVLCGVYVLLIGLFGCLAPPQVALDSGRKKAYHR